MVDPKSEFSDGPVNIFKINHAIFDPDWSLLGGGHAPAQILQSGPRHKDRAISFDPKVFIHRCKLNGVAYPRGKTITRRHRPAKKGFALGLIDHGEDRNPPAQSEAQPGRRSGQQEQGEEAPLSLGKSTPIAGS